jgi:hypothetical protein
MRGVALAAIAAAVLVVSVRYGSFVAGGSDSYCYVYQSARWASLIAHPFTSPLQEINPLAAVAPWPDVAATLAPAGHVPSPRVPGAIVPMCPAGLSMLMAPLRLLFGARAVFAVVPLFGALLVIATATVGGRYGARIGLAAALLVACSPVFLYQVLQPMSDVPAAALRTHAVAFATGTRSRDTALAGIATSLAILVRPNLLPLGFAIGLFLLLRPERTSARRIRAAVVYAAWCVPGCVAVAAIQQSFYGSPLSSGYGALDALFSAGHVLPNLRRYAAWLWQSHTPAIVLALLAPVLLPGGLTTLLLALFAIDVASYLPYTVFEDWSFLRFLLPTLPLLLVLMVAVLDALVRRVRMKRATLVVAIVTLALGALSVGEARKRSAFRLREYEARFERAGTFVGARLPARAVVLTLWETGSVRYYGHRNTVAWDQLDPAWLDRAVAYLRSSGREPYLLFEGHEESDFRSRFAGSTIGAVDWPPMADIGSQVKIYRVADRARYVGGENVATEYVR